VATLTTIIDSTELGVYLETGLRSVFTKMLKRHLRMVAELPVTKETMRDLFDHDVELVVSSIGFSGTVIGAVYLYYPATLALDLASSFLDMDKDELAEERGTIDDVIGELANMSIGGFKRALEARGHVCTLTLPSNLSPLIVYLGVKTRD